MTGVYSMWSPNYRAASRQEMFDAAMEQPLSITSTLLDQAKGGVLESFGLGTAIREAQLPEEAPTVPGITTEPGGRNFLNARRERPEELEARRADMGALDADAYKASAWFRDDVPWDAGMTEARAAALATMYDAKRVREFYAQKRPISAFFGNLAGQAVDPINYIPIAGPAVKAAALARFGKVGGVAAASSLDAAANTAVFGIGTAGERAKFGDDVSWETTVSQIATAALIGGAFGTIVGAVGRRRDARLVAETEQSLSTLRTTQEARIALNEGIDAIVRGEDVRLSPNATDPMARVAEQINPTRSPDLFAPLERQDLYRSTAVGRVIDNRAAHIADFETAMRGEVLATDPDLAARFRAAEEKFNAAQDKVAAIEEQLAARKQSDAVALIDQPSAERVRAIEAELAKKPSARRAAELESERDTIVESLGPDQVASAESDFRIKPQKQAKQARSALAAARQEFSKVRREADAIASKLDAVSSLRNRSSIDTSTARPEPVPEGIKKAEAAIAKSDDSKALATQYRVDPETGAFQEEADIKQLAAEGRFTGQDAETMAQAQADFETGAAYAEALKSVAGCML
jgi:hypothetical protein